MSEPFPIWSTVYLTADAARMFPKLQGRRGKVVRYTRKGTGGTPGAKPVVVWFGGKLEEAWAPSLLQTVPPPEPPP